MRLNGWQRLFVVVGIVWMCAVSSLAILTWPTVGDLSHSDVYAEMPEGSGRWFTDYSAWIAAKHGGVEVPLPIGADVTHLVAPDGPTVEIGGHVLQFFAGVSEADQNRAAGDYYAALGRAFRRRRIETLLTSLGFCAIPSAAVYLLGWGVAWVRRGFRQS